MDKYQFTKENVSQLNSFLRGELSAVETYEQAIEKTASDPAVRSTLLECQQSHRNRVAELSEYVRQLGGEPAMSSGLWGTFAKAVEGGAKAFGEKAAISALEEGEDHGLKDYSRDLSDLDPTVRAYVQNRILPEQQRTHNALSRLQHRI